MKFSDVLKAMKLAAAAFARGLVGRGKKTQKAGELAGEALELLDKEKKDGVSE